MARKFFYVCAGLFLLALSYHLGAKDVGAQAPPGTTIVGIAVDAHKGDSDDEDLFVMLANGDVYYSTFKMLPLHTPSEKVGNFWLNAASAKKR